MKASIEIKADVLKTLIVEDREEMRGIRLMIYNVITLFLTASFVATAFLFERFKVTDKQQILFVMDVLILILLWGFFMRLKKDLKCCRQYLNARQELINNLGKKSDSDDDDDLDPFPKGKEGDQIKDTELWLLPGIATVVIVVKLFIITTWL